MHSTSPWNALTNVVSSISNLRKNKTERTFHSLAAEENLGENKDKTRETGRNRGIRGRKQVKTRKQRESGVKMTKQGETVKKD